MALGSIIALVVGLIAVAAWYLRDMPREPAAAPQVAEAPKPTPAPDANNGSKISERVGGGPPLSAPAAGQVRQEVGVAQRAVLYEEDPAHPQAPRTQVGRVVWRLEGVNAGQGQPLETAVRAVVEFPEAGLTMNLLLRRNLDATLPASHTFELNFTTRQGEPGRVVRDVGVLQFKNEEGARGTPVAGLPVPVRENLFLIGLSNLNSDVERNIELLVRRNWIDLPVRLASGQRADHQFREGRRRRSGDERRLPPVAVRRRADGSFLLRRGFRGFDGGEVLLHRLLDLFERPHLDLADALARDAELGR